jgi:Fe-S-cluster containining protein
MPDQVVTVEGILKDQARMTPDDQFTFHCGLNLDCFTECCRDVSIVLTPYDILRLKKALRLDSTEFLERHTLPLFGPQQKFPLTILRMDPETKKCLFVAEQGCKVYADRPWACRMYPLGVAKPKNPTPNDHVQHPCHCVLSAACPGLSTAADVKGPPRRIGATRAKTSASIVAHHLSPSFSRTFPL